MDFQIRGIPYKKKKDCCQFLFATKTLKINRPATFSLPLDIFPSVPPPSKPTVGGESKSKWEFKIKTPPCFIITLLTNFPWYSSPCHFCCVFNFLGTRVYLLKGSFYSKLSKPINYRFHWMLSAICPNVDISKCWLKKLILIFDFTLIRCKK